MEKGYCLICDRINMIKRGENPYFVAELDTGYVVIADYQYFKGYTIFLCKKDVRELHELHHDFKMKFLEELSIVSEAVYHSYKPIKLNIELLGNTDSHVHWHIVPRHGTDPFPHGPAWLTDDKLLRSEKVRPSIDELRILKSKLLLELQRLTTNIKQSYIEANEV